MPPRGQLDWHAQQTSLGRRAVFDEETVAVSFISAMLSYFYIFIFFNDRWWLVELRLKPLYITLATYTYDLVTSVFCFAHFIMGFFNLWVKPVNITWQYFDSLFYGLTCTHSHPKLSYLVIYYKHKLSKINLMCVFVCVCSLCCRTKQIRLSVSDLIPAPLYTVPNKCFIMSDAVVNFSSRVSYAHTSHFIKTLCLTTTCSSSKFSGSHSSLGLIPYLSAKKNFIMHIF